MRSIHTISLFRGVVAFVIAAVIVGSCAFAFAPRAHAAQSTAELHALIEQLLAQLAALQAELSAVKGGSGDWIQGRSQYHRYTPDDDGRRGSAKITLLAPRSRAVFDKELPDDPVVVKWEADNIPDNAVVEVELEALQLSGGRGGVGGGVWSGEIPEGDSTGTYEWDIFGIGRADAGTYRVRVLVRECHSMGCTYNPDFPGQEEDVKTYARSSWRTIKIVNGGDEPDPYRTYRATLNGREVDSAVQISKEMAEDRCKVVYNDYDRHQFSGGDVVKCYWNGRLFMTVDEWKG